MNIKYYRKANYGTVSFYLADKNQATGFEMLTGRKTLTSKDQRGLAAILGVAIKFTEVLQPTTPVLQPTTLTVKQ